MSVERHQRETIATRTVHASCVVIADAGILLRGVSGAGKSRLAAALVAYGELRGGFARWVADDRVMLRRAGGRLIARPHPMIAGRCEARGLGILERRHEDQVVLRLVVDLAGEDEIERHPGAAATVTSLLGVSLPRLMLVAGRAGMYEAALVFEQSGARSAFGPRRSHPFQAELLGMRL